ncbi:T cell receptor beta chain MC.7.G5 [Stigmatopora argus]
MVKFDRYCFCASAAPLCSYDQAFFGEGTKLTVLEPNAIITPPTVTFFPPSEHECARGGDPDDVRTLVCAATDFYPDHVTVSWLVDGEKRERGVATDRRAVRRGDRYLLTTRLTVPAPQWLLQGRIFTCVFTFFDGKAYVDVRKSLRGREGTAEERLNRESFLKLMQTAKLSYCVLIVKSCVYAGFVTFLMWRRGVSGKTR